jgi:hypothetical protein
VTWSGIWAPFRVWASVGLLVFGLLIFGPDLFATFSLLDSVVFVAVFFDSSVFCVIVRKQLQNPQKNDTVNRDKELDAWKWAPTIGLILMGSDGSWWLGRPWYRSPNCCVVMPALEWAA